MNSKGETLDNCGITALVTAVQNFSNAILRGDLAPLTNDDFVNMLRELETCKRQLSALDSRLIIDATERDLPKSVGAKTVQDFLRQTLSLSRYDAAGRAKIARACGGLLDATGQPLTDTLSATAEAYESGAISRDHVRNMVDVMTHLPKDIPAETYAETEQLLVEHSLTGAPDDLPKIGREILARLDPEGTVISDADRRRRRGITIGRPGVDGMSKIEGWLTPELRAYLDAFLAKFARPGMCNIDDAEPLALSVKQIDSKVLDDAARRDRRDAGQRTHDALYALLQPVAPAKRATATDESTAPATVISESATAAAGFGQHRGLKTQVILTMSLADLERGAGLATTATGGHVSINEALKMAEGTRPVLAVLDPHGIPLFLGKSQRLASPGQRLALIARDKGCTRPGCDAPASMCAAHHITDWANDGPTDLSNLALACDHCHALVNDSADGWNTVVMGKDSDFPGRCGWIAPKHVDPTGTPTVNQRHHLAGLAAAAVESSCQQWGSRVA
ncbi:HNH endonuclease signature motif containing protein [Nocardia heshunensis]